MRITDRQASDAELSRLEVEHPQVELMLWQMLQEGSKLMLILVIKRCDGELSSSQTIIDSAVRRSQTSTVGALPENS